MNETNNTTGQSNEQQETKFVDKPVFSVIIISLATLIFCAFGLELISVAKMDFKHPVVVAIIAIVTLLIVIFLCLFFGKTDAAKSILSSPKNKAKKAELEQQNSDLQAENERLTALLTPELADVKTAQEKLTELQGEIAKLEKTKSKYTGDIKKLADKFNAESKRIENEIATKEKEIIQLDEEILVQSFGLYKPQFSFATADEYKARLDLIRDKQKDMIKSGAAVTGSSTWTVNGDAKKGKKMVADMQKLLLRAFNGECDELVAKVKYNNYDQYVKRIYASCTAISKLGQIMNVSITPGYVDLKIQELTLAFEHAQKKQEEKDAQKLLRAQMREEAKLQKELEAERIRLEKEQTHYENALARIEAQLASDPKNPALLKKKAEYEQHNADIATALKDVDYRQANKRAGYVYIISNIGAFGENIYKIGMTRRLEPMERVDELGDASVPFNFDVHAMIFTADAPALEAALHKKFADRKLNMVNQRREFFHVTLDEIKAVVKENYDKTVEWTDIPDAEQYRVSLKMRNV